MRIGDNAGALMLLKKRYVDVASPSLHYDSENFFHHVTQLKGIQIYRANLAAKDF